MTPRLSGKKTVKMWGEATQESGTERCHIPMGRHQTKHTLQQGIFTNKMHAFYFTKMPSEVRLRHEREIIFSSAQVPAPCRAGSTAAKAQME